MSDKEFKIDEIRATKESTVFSTDIIGPHKVFITGTSKWSDFKNAKLKKVDWLRDTDKPE